jgi:hypothetical protein
MFLASCALSPPTSQRPAGIPSADFAAFENAILRNTEKRFYVTQRGGFREEWKATRVIPTDPIMVGAERRYISCVIKYQVKRWRVESGSEQEESPRSSNVKRAILNESLPGSDRWALGEIIEREPKAN